MNGALLFYLSRSFLNKAVSRVKRLKRPKYLVPAVVGLGYFYLVFFRQFASRGGPRTAIPGVFAEDTVLLVEAACAFLVFAAVLLPWVLPWKNRGLAFTEAEVQFLFPAPLPRRTLINFRLIKMQLGILFGTVISYFFLGRGRFVEHPVYLLLTLWLVYSFLSLAGVGTSLAQASLLEHGASGFRRQGGVLALLAAIAIAVLVWARWFIPAFPETGMETISSLQSWLLRLTDSGPAYYLLFPFRLLVRPAFAPDAASFAARLGAALTPLAVVYLWVMRSDAGFEEASLERARIVATRLEAVRTGKAQNRPRPSSRVRRPLFRLSPEGPAHTAIFWKNLNAIGRIGTLRTVPALVALGVSITIIVSHRGEGQHMAAMIVGTLAGALAGFLTLLGPMLLRDDLRSDLLQIDLLKTYPIQGWSLVVGEVLAPAAVLAAAQWGLLVIAVIAFPGFGNTPWPLLRRILIGLCAALIFPCLSLLGLLIQNAAALILPGWVQLGKEHRQGIEAMGQRMITMTGTMLVAVFALLPAGVLFAIVFFAGYWLLGAWILPAAALAAAAGLLAEAGFAVFWLGRFYDRFDLSIEGPGH